MKGKNEAPVKKCGLLLHPHQETAVKALETMRRAADSHGIETIELDRSDVSFDKSAGCQVIISVGGDGTLLAAVRFAYPADIPVWGINVGQLGYLTTSTIDEIESHVSRLAKGDYWIENRSMIEGIVTRADGKDVELVALNDIVVHRNVPGGGLMALDCELDGRFLATYEADGLIISTPTGSTGYNLSAGGSILSTTLPAFEITPICAHSFSARSLIIDDSSVLVVRPRLKAEGEVAYATADGQEVAELANCPVRTKPVKDDSCRVTLKRAERPIGLVRFDEVVFFGILRDKLGWADAAPPNRMKRDNDG
jgi:NAD+ kinase